MEEVGEEGRGKRGKVGDKRGSGKWKGNGGKVGGRRDGERGKMGLKEEGKGAKGRGERG